MTDEYQERGLFKQLVLIVASIAIWILNKWDGGE